MSNPHSIEEMINFDGQKANPSGNSKNLARAKTRQNKAKNLQGTNRQVLRSPEQEALLRTGGGY